MLSSVTFDAGENQLDIALSGSDSVTATVLNDQVQISINGTQTGATPDTDDVYSIRVAGGSEANLIDLSGLDAADFSYLLISTSISGGDGDDTIHGSGVMDEINADGGNDFVDGGAGYDDIFGGDGLDILNGGEGNDCVSGGPGDDTLWSGSGEPDDSGILNGDCGLSVLDGVEDSGDCAFFSITDVTVLESDGIAVFTVTLSRGLASQSIVDVETADGSAVANSDYIPLSRRTLSFVPGETVKLVEVPVMDDASTTAATEIFHLVLSDPIGAHR